MTKYKNLVILVADYPFGTGEPFLEDEIKLLELEFDKIILLHTSDRQSESNKFSLYLPQNAFIEKINDCSVKQSKFRWLFSFIVLYQLLLAKFKHKKKINFSLIRTITYYWSKAKTGKDQIKEIINKYNFNPSDTLFYSYWCDENAISLALLNKDENFEFVTRLHGWDLYFERHDSQFLPFREFIFNHAKRIFTISNDGRKYILDNKLCINRKKVITSRLGVLDFQVNKRYSQTESSGNDFDLVILTLSHINKVKRLDRVIDALKVIDDIKIKWIHIGYGYENYQNQFNKEINQKLSKKENITVELLGHLSKKEVKNVLENIEVDFILNVSDTEGVPVSLMEAASSSLPMIAYNIGGIPGIIENDENGYLLEFNQDNSINLKNLIFALREFHNLSNEERKKFSNRSKEIWNKNYNIKKTSEFFIRALNDDFESEVIECKQCLINSEIYPSIVLDKYGICDVCSIVSLKNEKVKLFKENNYLDTLLNTIKSNSKNNKYDCMIGISGGVDSAYLALKAKEWGLNPLLVHIDNGWNSEIAVSNIHLLIKQLNFDLYTVVINWSELKDLVRSFLKASVIDIDWANEMCAQAALNEVARKFNIKHVLTGHQLATEGWMPDNVVHYKLDLINFKAIHRKFGKVKLKTYPMIGYFKTYYYEKILGIKFYYPLDYIEYNKEKVKIELAKEYGWKDYGQKHFESIFTRFYQGYFLIKKFRIDKRKFHYSASILSGQLSRDEAKALVNSNEYIESGMMQEDKEFICKKLGFSELEFEEIINSPPKKHTDYPSMINVLNKLREIKHVLQNNR